MQRPMTSQLLKFDHVAFSERESVKSANYLLTSTAKLQLKRSVSSWRPFLLTNCRGKALTLNWFSQFLFYQTLWWKWNYSGCVFPLFCRFWGCGIPVCRCQQICSNSAVCGCVRRRLHQPQVDISSRWNCSDSFACHVIVGGNFNETTQNWSVDIKSRSSDNILLRDRFPGKTLRPGKFVFDPVICILIYSNEDAPSCVTFGC